MISIFFIIKKFSDNLIIKVKLISYAHNSFFTYKVGIRDWLESGIFKREVQLYKELVNKGYKITFVTYDKDSYSELLGESGIIHLPLFRNINEPKSKFMYFVKSLLVVYRSHKIFDNADIFKTNQLLGSWIPIVAKLFYRKKLIVRTGYDLLEFTLKNKKEPVENNLVLSFNASCNSYFKFIHRFF